MIANAPLRIHPQEKDTDNWLASYHNGTADTCALLDTSKKAVRNAISTDSGTISRGEVEKGVMIFVDRYHLQYTTLLPGFGPLKYIPVHDVHEIGRAPGGIKTPQ